MNDISTTEALANLASWGIRGTLWQKHGLHRIYINEYKGAKIPCFLEKVGDTWQLNVNGLNELEQKCFNFNENVNSDVKTLLDAGFVCISTTYTHHKAGTFEAIKFSFDNSYIPKDFDYLLIKTPDKGWMIANKTCHDLKLAWQILRGDIPATAYQDYQDQQEQEREENEEWHFGAPDEESF